MAIDRFVVIGLARPRTEWFSEVGRWANGASIPVDYVKCLGADEVRARLAGGRRVSAALLDAGAHGVERDLIDELHSHGSAVIIVSDERVLTDWIQLGADATLPSNFDRASLLDRLDEHASPLQGSLLASAAELDDLDDERRRVSADSVGWRGRLVAVCGGSGAGTSTVSMALAQGLASCGPNTDVVTLADLAAQADLAVYHDACDVVPGLQELVEAHRGSRPTTAVISGMLFDIDERGYRLLLGLRRRQDWTTLRPRALTAAMDSLRRSGRWLVCDIDDEFEGELETASHDLEERNGAARHAASTADVVVVVGTATMKGTFDLVRATRSLVGLGVDGNRILPVINHAPRSPRARAEVIDAIEGLGGLTGIVSPVFLPERRGLETIHRNAMRLPEQLASPVSVAVEAVFDRLGPLAESRVDPSDEPLPIRPAPRHPPEARAS